MPWPYSDPRWASLREDKLAKEPVCEICGDYNKLEVHHVNPLTPQQRARKDEKAGLPPLKKLQVLCKTCHSVITASGSNTEATTRARWDALLDEEFTHDYNPKT